MTAAIGRGRHAAGKDGTRQRLEIDGEHRCTLAEFLDANEGLDADERGAISGLAIGESYSGGGGAAATWSVRRVS